MKKFLSIGFFACLTLTAVLAFTTDPAQRIPTSSLGTNVVSDRLNVWVSVSGDDYNSGTFATPKRTIGAAKNVLTNNGTVFVLPGRYNERDLMRSGLTNYAYFFYPGARLDYYQSATNDSGRGLLDERGITT